ncbi:Type I restriction-modification system, DNA-methyltransferase subunit M [Minicystis rosea]|nr:Type I restriction-modification system, DNA-methyltransferase subunit M [Minicystis rosea]
MTQTSLPLANGSEGRRQDVRNAVKNACDSMREDGVNPRDYVEQLAWMFFLKAFDEAETRRASEAEFSGEAHEHRLPPNLRWSNWSKMTNKPDDLLTFVDGKLWPALRKLGTDAIGQQFNRIFSTVRNHCRTGSSLAKVINQVNRLDFGKTTDIIVLSEIYEGLLKDVAADSAGYAGEFYTQRHIVRAMVEVVRPKLGERVYDPGFGTAGFLFESAEYIRRHTPQMAAEDLERLQHHTFYGLELKPLTYLLGSMNMLLHGIEGAGLELANTLEVHQSNVPEKNKYQVILSNPPYGGKMSKESQDNFTVRSGSTEILFLQHIMANLAKGGRAAVVVPEGVLFRGGPDAKMRERLIKEFQLHTVLSLPAGCFLPYTGVKTNVLFFDRPMNGSVTEAVWYYELTNDGFELKQTRRPIAGNQLPDFLAKWEERVLGDQSWPVTISELEKNGWDLTPRNPRHPEDDGHRPALDLVRSIREKEERIAELLGELEDMLTGDV